MSKTIEVTFAFEIGDEVVCGSARRLAVRAADQYQQTHAHKDGYKNKPAMCIPVFQILERIAQECPGGVQRHYVCRGFMADKYGDGAAIMSEKHQFLEHELEALATPPIGGDT